MKAHVVELGIPVKVIRVGGDTYPHRFVLKEMGFFWDSWDEVWEGEETEDRWHILNGLGGLTLEVVTRHYQHQLHYVDIDDLPDETASITAVMGVIRELKDVIMFTRVDQQLGCFQRFLLADETGVIPCIAWNIVESASIKEGELYVLEKVQLRVDKRGYKELHCHENTRFHNVGGEDIDRSLVDEQFMSWLHQTVSIAKLSINVTSRISGMITQFDNVRDFGVCPSCGDKVETETYCWRCGEVSPRKRLVCSGVITDDSNAFKFTFFGNQVKSLLRLTAREYNEATRLTVIERLEMPALINKINDLIGKWLIFTGRLKISENTGIKTFYGDGVYDP